MKLLLLSLASVCFALDIITDGGFDGVATWNITPPVGLCRGWCHSSDVWREPAHSGLNFVFANPSEGSISVSQHIVQPSIPYNRCELKAYLRVVNTLDSQVLVLWDSTQYQFDLFEWEKNSEVSASEWTPITLLLYGSSDEIEFRLQTMSITYISMDDVSLNCYQTAFYENPEVQFLLCVILIAVVLAILSLIARMLKLDINFCCCSRNKVAFESIVIESEPEDTEFDGFPLQKLGDAIEGKNSASSPAASSSSSSSSSPVTVVEHK